jgi:phenylacetic acid degradation operon negative regulatory protein
MATPARPSNDAPTTAPKGRRVGRARAQRLLVTLFGDYWTPQQPPIPSAGLVRVLAEFGITAANARATLSRLTQRGVLVRHQEGRRTSYGVTADAWRVIGRGARRIFAVEEEPRWDGAWTLVAFSLPNDDAELRRLLRARLRWLTFAPIFDATWLTPHDRVEQARDQLDELGVKDAFVVRARDLAVFPRADERLREAWDLGALARRYLDFQETYSGLREEAAGGRVAPDQALVGRTELVDDWRGLVRDDPELPNEFLAEPVPRSPARDVFLATYRALEPLARRRFDDLIRTSARSTS